MMRCMMNTNSMMKQWTVLALAVLWIGSTATWADVTNDRLYSFGEDGVEDASANIILGSGSNNVAPGKTLDSNGTSNASYQDLRVGGAPTYVDVGSTGLQRPGANAGERGGQFNGTSDYLYAVNLNSPQSTQSSYYSNDPQFFAPFDAGLENYFGIANRGIQLWVRPDGANAGNLQHVVQDANQHGVYISENNTWVMRYAGADTDTGVAVTFDDWSHVMIVRPFGPSGANSGSRLYVDGQVIASVTGGYDGGSRVPLAIGANTDGPGWDEIDGDVDFTGGTEGFFQGVIDDMTLFVMGDNSKSEGPDGLAGTDDDGKNWGSFNYLTDNSAVATSGLYNGVFGDISGPAGTPDGVLDDHDVNDFAAHWLGEYIVTAGGQRGGDIDTYLDGDLNANGVIDMIDLSLMHQELLAQNGQGFPMQLLGSVPEPATMMLLGMGSMALIRRRRCDAHTSRLDSCKGENVVIGKMNSQTCRVLFVLAIGLLSLTGSTAWATQLAPDDASINSNLQLWLNDPVNNYNPTTGIWTDSSSNGFDMNPVGFVGATSITYVQPQLVSSLNSVRFFGDDDDMLVSPSINSGAGLTDLTIFSVYRFTNLVSASNGLTRLAGIGSTAADGVAGADFFNLAADPSIRKDNGQIGAGTYSEPHPVGSFIIRASRMDSVGNVVDEWFNTSTVFNNNVMTNAGNAYSTGNDLFYLGDVRAGITPVLNSSSTSDFDIAETIVYNTALTNTQIEQISEYLAANVSALNLDEYPTLEVNRQTGNISLVNNTGSAVDISGYSIRSTIGSLNPSDWLSIAENYDMNIAPDPGDGSVDNDEAWLELTDPASRIDLSEARPGGQGTLADAQSVNLGDAWLQTPIEDISFQLMLADGTVVDSVVRFTGDALIFGDLDFDGDLDAQDWATFKSGMKADMSGLTIPESYRLGDLNADGDNDGGDYVTFKQQYELINGDGSFAQMVSVPEPASMLLLGLGGLGLLRRRRHASNSNNRRMKTVKPFRMIVMIAMSALLLIAQQSMAVSITFDNTATDLGQTNWVDQGYGDDGYLFFGTHDTGVASGKDADMAGVLKTGLFYSDPIIVIASNDVTTRGNYVGGGADDATAAVALQDPSGTGTFTPGSYVRWGIGSDDMTGIFRIGLNQEIQSMRVGVLVNNQWANDNNGGQTYTSDVPPAIQLTMNNGAPDQLDGPITSTDTSSTAPRADWYFFDVTDVAVGDELTFKVQRVFDSNSDKLAAFGGLVFSDVVLAGPTLEVNRTTGSVHMLHTGSADMDFDYYEVTSDAGSLNSTNWNSLEDQNMVDYPGGDDSGNGWEEGGNPSAHDVTEAYLLGNSTLTSQTDIDLGKLFTPSATEDVSLRLYDPTNGMFVQGLVTYVEGGVVLGDVNGDGLVNGFDVDPFVDVLLNGPYQAEADVNDDGAVNGFDVDPFVALVLGGGSGPQGTEVPEPATLAILGLGGWLTIRRRK